MWLWIHSYNTENLSFLNCIADQDKNHSQVWYYLRMWLLLVFCLMILIFPVLCLMPYISYLTWVREIYSRTGKQHWPHCEMSLIARSTVSWHCCSSLDFMKNRPGYFKNTPTMWGLMMMGEKTLIIFLLTRQYIRRIPISKYYYTTDCPCAPLGYAVWNVIV